MPYAQPDNCYFTGTLQQKILWVFRDHSIFLATGIWEQV